MNFITCPGCGSKLRDQCLGMSASYNASGECEALYHELSGYLIMNPDVNFRMQHAVDAYGAQHSGANVKNIRTAFSLIGLYLAFERNYTGRKVQLAHMELAKRNIQWPSFKLPHRPYSLTVKDVIAAEEGRHRDERMMKWAEDVWDTWAEYHQWTRDICEKYLKK
jgi:hypothetical protein